MLFSGFRDIVNIDLVIGVTLSLFIVGVLDGLTPAQIRHLKEASKLLGSVEKIQEVYVHKNLRI